MAKIVLTGIDSAWSENNKGAVVSAIQSDHGWTVVGPETASFDECFDHVRTMGKDASTHLLAIDQPLIVVNDSGQRPVEKVVGSILGRYRGGTCSSNRGNHGGKYAEIQKQMSGEGAPIWSFLARLKDELNFADYCGLLNRHNSRGRVFCEVFPAMANLGLFQEFWKERQLSNGRVGRSVPKYNPGKKNFVSDDWKLLVELVNERLGMACPWLDIALSSGNPRKEDQDKLDSLICLCICLHWMNGGATCVVGDSATGYMVIPCHGELLASLEEAARSRNVQVSIGSVFLG